MKTSEQIRDYVDNLQEWDYISELWYKIDKIEDDLYTVSEQDFDTKYLFSSEIAEELYELEVDNETNKGIDYDRDSDI